MHLLSAFTAFSYNFPSIIGFVHFDAMIHWITEDMTLEVGVTITLVLKSTNSLKKTGFE